MNRFVALVSSDETTPGLASRLFLSISRGSVGCCGGGAAAGMSGIAGTKDALDELMLPPCSLGGWGGGGGSCRCGGHAMVIMASMKVGLGDGGKGLLLG